MNGPLDPETRGSGDSASDLERLARAATIGFDASSDREGPDRDRGRVRQLLAFGLDRGVYAIDVERIREIVRVRETTRLPRSPDWLLGVVALRGEVVEIIDLRLRLGLPAAEPDRASRVIVLHGDGERSAGLLVDSVSEVLRVPEGGMMPAQGLDLLSVVAVCRRDGEFVSVIDPDLALGETDG
ncbi:MAG TPA: chemotaxis protein CheW [Deltaproteobacteria bacterium]|nr:chemotaxis protein CheW [Deltaproteobacteria bacterium]